MLCHDLEAPLPHGGIERLARDDRRSSCRQENEHVEIERDDRLGPKEHRHRTTDCILLNDAVRLQVVEDAECIGQLGHRSRVTPIRQKVNPRRGMAWDR
jgi:hypothetical protein